jgi:medium-chain acyl-[acyl-carrier-protein] hydrolase
MDRQSLTVEHLSKAWVVHLRPNPQARWRLFCFPFAGSGTIAYRTWPAHLPPDVEVCAIRLPGRETRLREPLFTRLEPLVEALAVVLRPFLDKPFVFFGHSLGALISFELARQLRRQDHPGPSHLFVSSYRAPQLPLLHPPVHQAPEAEFIARLRGFNGTPEIILQDAELRELVLPILRADFAIWETYEFANETPLNCPISAFVGEQDKEVSPQDMAAWRVHTHNTFRMHVFPGDHFFWQSTPRPLLQTVAELL